MEEQQQVVRDTIDKLLGTNTNVKNSEIMELLQATGNKPKEAAELYIQQISLSTKNESGNTNIEINQQVETLQELIGENIEKQIVMELLQQANMNIQQAVEIYFNRKKQEIFSQEQELQNVSNNTISNSQSIEMDLKENETSPEQNINQVISSKDTSSSIITPPIPPTDTVEPVITNPLSYFTESKEQRESIYEITMQNNEFLSSWKIVNVFDRAIVESIESNGVAEKAGIKKSDILVNFRGIVVTESNCNQILQQLMDENLTGPSILFFQRDNDKINGAAALDEQISATISPKQLISDESNTSSGIVEESNPTLDKDGDTIMTDTDISLSTTNMDNSQKHVPKYGILVLCNAIEKVQEAVGTNEAEFKNIVDLLLIAEFNMDVAVNYLLNKKPFVTDFRNVVGHNWDATNPDTMMGVTPYNASIPSGPLGLTVENILERTIVVDIKRGGAAERANVKQFSWLVGLNGESITHLAHSETLKLIETAKRPLQLQFVVLPQDQYTALRQQLSMNIRQKTERPIAESDRMSFQVFQAKIHQAIRIFPKMLVLVLFKYLNDQDSAFPHTLAGLLSMNDEEIFEGLSNLPESFDSALGKETVDMEEEENGEMCSERRFLLDLFAKIHDYVDKGEAIVIKTLVFLGWLIDRLTAMQNFVDKNAGASTGIQTRDAVWSQRYALLIDVIMHVLESISIIENHATWDVMVDDFKVLVNSFSDEKINSLIIPMLARLSISVSPTARIVPLSLLSIVYKRVEGDLHVQLRGLLDRMCCDDNPLLRRAVVSIVPGLAEVAGPSAASWTVTLLEKATGDNHEIVRVFAVKSCLQLAKIYRKMLVHPTSDLKVDNQAFRLLLARLMPLVSSYTSDTLWQVRLEIVKVLPDYCQTFGLEYMDVFVDYFVGMVRDSTIDVRRAIADIVLPMCHVMIKLAVSRIKRDTKVTANAAVNGNGSNPDVLDINDIDVHECIDSGTVTWVTSEKELVVAAQTKIVRSLLPPTFSLASDHSQAVRIALAKSICASLQYLRKDNYPDVTKIITQLLDANQDPILRATGLEELARHADCTSGGLSSIMFAGIKALLNHTQWRVRLRLVACVKALSERRVPAPEASVIPLANGVLELLLDHIHAIRIEACDTLGAISECLSREWLVRKAVPRITTCLSGTVNGRMTGLIAIEKLANSLKKCGKLGDMVQIVIEQCTSRTPNIRFRALKTLGVLVQTLDDEQTTRNTLEIVTPLANPDTESDADVREAAEALCSILK